MNKLDEEEIKAIAPRVLRCPANGVMLGSDYILQALEILKDLFQFIECLIDSIIFQKNFLWEVEFNLKERNVFVVHKTGLMHRVVLTNLNHDLEDKLLVLES